MQPLAPDLTTNIVKTLYLTVAHNYLVIAYFAGALLSAVLAFFRPSRFYLLMFFGFALLSIGFWYDKHVIDAFREQTLLSLLPEGGHYRFGKLVDLIVSGVLPIFFYVSGWLLIFVAIVFAPPKPKQ